MTIGTFDMGWVVRLAAIVGTVTPIWVAPAAAQEVPETGGRNVRAVVGRWDSTTRCRPPAPARRRQKAPAGNKIVIDRSGTSPVERTSGQPQAKDAAFNQDYDR